MARLSRGPGVAHQALHAIWRPRQRHRESGHRLVRTTQLHQDLGLELAGWLEGDGRAEVHGQGGLVLGRFVSSCESGFPVPFGHLDEGVQSAAPYGHVGTHVARRHAIGGLLDNRMLLLGLGHITAKGSGESTPPGLSHLSDGR